MYINLPEQDAYNQSDQVTIFNTANNTDNSGNGSTCIDPPAAPLRQDQKKDLLNLFELILDSQSDEDVPDAVRQRQTLPNRANSSRVSITRAQKNEILLLINNTLEGIIDESTKIKRRHYTKDQKDEIVQLMNGCKDDGMSAYAAIKYINTIQGYEKVTRKMTREWKVSNENAPRGRKVCDEFEREVLREISVTTG